jgi:hypothetical protein
VLWQIILLASYLTSAVSASKEEIEKQYIVIEKKEKEIQKNVFLSNSFHFFARAKSSKSWIKALIFMLAWARQQIKNKRLRKVIEKITFFSKKPGSQTKIKETIVNYCKLVVVLLRGCLGKNCCLFLFQREALLVLGLCYS